MVRRGWPGLINQLFHESGSYVITTRCFAHRRADKPFTACDPCEGRGQFDTCDVCGVTGRIADDWDLDQSGGLEIHVPQGGGTEYLRAESENEWYARALQEDPDLRAAAWIGGDKELLKSEQ